MNTESNHLSVIPDLNKSRCVNAVRRIARKGLRTDRVWIIDRKDRNGVITHSLVLPYAYVKELTPSLQRMAVIYCGEIRGR